jgi:hypothetical protein
MSNNNKNKTQGNNNESQTKTSVIDLEKLKIEYSLQLKVYKQAISDYINFLQNDSSQSCINYSSNSKGISQECYNNIWKKSGCGGGNLGYPSASASWQQSQTLNGLIQDSWYWATLNDADHRNGCYAQNNTTYNTTTSPNYNINKPELTTIPGKMFLGTGRAGNQGIYSGGTIEQCKALCSTTANCSGATYNPTAYGQPMCLLRSGEGQLIPSRDSANAIIPKVQKFLLTIEGINNKLIQTNQQIQNVIDKSEPVYNSMKTEGQEKNKELVQNYLQLVDEREKILEMVKSYEDLDQTEIQGDLKINQKYYTYILLVVVAIGVIVLLYKFSNIFPSGQGSTQNYNQSGGGEMPNPSYIVLLIIIVIIILINYYTNIKTTTTNASNSVYNTFGSLFSNFSSLFSMNDI